MLTKKTMTVAMLMLAILAIAFAVFNRVSDTEYSGLNEEDVNSRKHKSSAANRHATQKKFSPQARATPKSINRAYPKPENTNPPRLSVFTNALKKRLQQRYGYLPTETELNNELNRIEWVHKLTDPYMFNMATAGFESIMADDEQDATWESEINSYLSDRNRQIDFLVSNVQDVTCTSRVCRLNLEHGCLEDQKQFARDMAMSMGFQINAGEIFTEPTQDATGVPGTSMYITKKMDPLILVDIRDAILDELNLARSNYITSSHKPTGQN